MSEREEKPKANELELKTAGILNKKWGFSWKNVFSGGAKIIAGMLADPGAVIDGTGEVLQAISVDNTVEEKAWWLFMTSLKEAVQDLIREEPDFRFSKPLEGDKSLVDSQEKFFRIWEKKLDGQKVYIKAEHIRWPGKFPLLKEFCESLARWLQTWGVKKHEAEQVARRFPAYFVFAFNGYLRQHKAAVHEILAELETASSEAVERIYAIREYHAGLIKQTQEPMFAEPFSLSDIYVPLLAYWEKVEGKKKGVSKRIREHFESLHEGEASFTKVLVKPQVELAAWAKSKEGLYIRLISGGPGSGKSSLAKMLAAELAQEDGEIQDNFPVYFIQLSRFSYSGDLKRAIQDHIQENETLGFDPLDRKYGDACLFIFDGLDELAMQGKAGKEIADSFLKELRRTLGDFNEKGKYHAKALVSSRELILSASNAGYNDPGQILHLLGFDKIEIEDLIEEEGIENLDLLPEDLLAQWWQKYFRLKKSRKRNIPEELSNLKELHSQPLLNYLLALSWERKKEKVDFSTTYVKNAIYEDLIAQIYDRDLENREDTGLKGLINEEEFFSLLEDIAIAAWHSGEVRTAKWKDIELRCKISRNHALLDKFSEEGVGGHIRLLTAFYFKMQKKSGEEEFEFTHKSFGENLVARKIAKVADSLSRRVIKSRNSKVQSGKRRGRGREDFQESFDIPEALEKWRQLTGPTEAEANILDFLEQQFLFFSERWFENQPSKIEFLQESKLIFSELFQTQLSTGFLWQKERLSPIEERLQTRNAEESLLYTLQAVCLGLKAHLTDEEEHKEDWVAQIKWPTHNSFAHCLSRLFGYNWQTNHNSLPLRSLNLAGQIITGGNRGFKMQNAWLPNLKWTFGNFQNGNFNGTNFSNCTLSCGTVRSIFQVIEINGVKESASAMLDFVGPIFVGAKLRNAIFHNANIDNGDFSFCDLSHADITNCNFTSCQLQRATLTNIIMDQKSLKGAYDGDTLLIGQALEDFVLRKTGKPLSSYPPREVSKEA